MIAVWRAADRPPAARLDYIRHAVASWIAPFDLRPEDTTGFATEIRAAMSPIGLEAELTAWIRLKEPAFEPVETALILLDAMPPAFYAAATEPVVAPTADLAAHLTDGLAVADFEDWALIETTTEQASAGWALDSIQLWSQAGVLLAAARQTRRILHK
jgi:acyl-CoA thioesterase